jgi:phenylalanine ammonia-lyase
MSVTNTMEKTRLSLHHLGKILFGQCAELINPAMNRSLPSSLAATDPSLDYHAKGIDIASAAYVAELGYLLVANPVSTTRRQLERQRLPPSSHHLHDSRHVASCGILFYMSLSLVLY